MTISLIQSDVQRRGELYRSVYSVVFRAVRLSSWTIIFLGLNEGIRELCVVMNVR